MKTGLSFLLLALLYLPSTAQPKNILILYSDDQSYHALGAMGNKQVITPNLDKLATQGMLFTQTHVMGGHQGAVCMPSRAMLLTGRYVNRLPRDGAIIPDSLISLPEILRQQGYTTFHTGKWHSDKASHYRMFSAGGPIFFGGMHHVRDGGQFHPTVQPFDPMGIYPPQQKWISDTFSTTLYADAAIQFFNSSAARQKPFFCYVAFTSPHDPRTPPKAAAEKYRGKNISLPSNFLPQHPFDNGDLNVRDEKLLPRPLHPDTVKEDIRNYYAMVTEMDAQVGRILTALETSGLSKNTIVVFASDNGLAMSQHGLLGKQNLYEHSIRVPMIMRGPGIPAGKAFPGFVYLSDIAPTLYEMLQIKAPSTTEAISFAPAFKDPGFRSRSFIYNVYGHWSRSIKSNDGFKLIVYNVDGQQRQQLFDLKKDPWEKTDLSSNPTYKAKISQLQSQLQQEMRQTGDLLQLELADWGRSAQSWRGRGS
jgi:arylsulfatase A-like enzyme